MTVAASAPGSSETSRKLARSARPESSRASAALMNAVWNMLLPPVWVRTTTNERPASSSRSPTPTPASRASTRSMSICPGFSAYAPLGVPIAIVKMSKVVPPWSNAMCRA